MAADGIGFFTRGVQMLALTKPVVRTKHLLFFATIPLAVAKRLSL